MSHNIVFTLFSLLFLTSITVKADIDLGSCQLHCQNDQNVQFTGQRPSAITSQGPPGKRGPTGTKGDQGPAGPNGPKGEPAEQCICPEHDMLLNKINELTEQLRKVHAPRDCRDVLSRRDGSRGGVYTIYPQADKYGRGVDVYCDVETDDGGWIVIQRRMDGSEDFYRNWGDYETGFGNLNGEFWLGLEKIHYLMTEGSYELRFDLEDFDNNTRFAKYSSFVLGPKESNFTITTVGYSGNAGNSMTLNNAQFSTKDQDNDVLLGGSCANLFKGGWWYTKCHSANLNGLYLRGHYDSYANGVDWSAWKGLHYSLKFTEIKMRKSE